jgi:HSP20 family molecular chaperone IbpA
MSFYNFPGYSAAPDTSFHRLFNLLDQFDDYQGKTTTSQRQMKSFNPKFDVKEVGETYELHGELPGVEQKDIEIEFSDDHTISIKGRTERSYQSGTPPAGFVEGPTSGGAITEAGENGHSSKDHHATVEDEAANKTNTDVAKKSNTDVTKKEPEHAKKPQDKFWVSERSVGEFSRSFSFPVRVDQDAVRASMKNGILSIVVPKAKKQSSRKITIN